MYSKIAARNVKKSFKDYAIYFLTLTLAVCIFYSFNSIESQKAFMEIEASGADYASTLMKAMSNVSVFVSLILGGLILYANNFLIKKRKKELGLYMTLGMGRTDISRILVMETLLVGVISLMSGLLLGIGVSQGLSTFTLKLFDLPISEYQFAISTGAIGKTVLYFGIMFVLVMLFNIRVVSNYKIIDLLTADRRNEEIKFKNPMLYFVTFILCVVSLGFSYQSVIKIGLDYKNPMFQVSIIMGLLGTLMFFFSLSGFILFVVKKNKKVYFKGLNIFIIKQLNSKVNTNFISMSLICIMLFITMTVLSTGISFKRSIDVAAEEATPFDASIMLVNEDGNYNIEDILNTVNFKISNNEKYVSYNLYQTGMKIGDFLTKENTPFTNVNVDFIKVSDYNKILKLKGEKEIHLNNNEVFISNDNRLVDPINERLKNSNKINIKEKEYLIKNSEAKQESLQTSYGVTNPFTIVINDEYLSGYKISTSVINVNYLDGNREEYNKKYDSFQSDFYDKVPNLNIKILAGMSKDTIYAESKGLTTTILYIGIYVGIVFLITCMAVLALQQLSEASDSIERYKSLMRIGANRQMVDKTIFIQTLVYFSLPVILALIHSVIGIYVVNNFINRFQETDISFSSLMTALFFIAIYAGYFYTTYIGYKNIVKSNT